MAGKPTPEQTADYLVRKLEQTIRDNRSGGKGMSFSTWQQVAREEIANALRNAEKRHHNDGRATTRLALVSVVAMVTIGFWGAAVTVNKEFGPIASVIFMVAGAVLCFTAGELIVRKLNRRYADHVRALNLAKIEEVDKRIKRMEAEMQKKADRLKDRMEEIQV